MRVGELGELPTDVKDVLAWFILESPDRHEALGATVH
jgi:hypothetical protein